jgi:hypothetical protein
MKLDMFETKFKTFGGIFPEINLDSSIKDGILLTTLRLLASKLEVPTLIKI